jgi:hypothetical protein
LFPVCDLHQRQGDNADSPLRPSGRLQEVLREDHPDSGVAATASAQMRHLQSEDPQIKSKQTKLAKAFGLSVSSRVFRQR